MNKFLEVVYTLWRELESVFEFLIYMSIAYFLSQWLGITRIQAIVVIFAYFFLNIIRVHIEKSR